MIINNINHKYIVWTKFSKLIYRYFLSKLRSIIILPSLIHHVKVINLMLSKKMRAILLLQIKTSRQQIYTKYCYFQSCSNLFSSISLKIRENQHFVVNSYKWKWKKFSKQLWIIVGSICSYLQYILLEI